MKIDVAYGRDLDDSMLQELQFLEADACACFDSLDAEDWAFVICAIPAETFKHFKRRVASTLFLMKTKREKSKKRVIGIACLSRMGSKRKTLRLHTVYVKPAHRGKGIGTAIVKKALQAAKKLECSTTLGANPLNTKAISLYERAGFKICKGQSIEMCWSPFRKRAKR